MLEFAKNKELWDKVRCDDAFARHRREIAEKYNAHFNDEVFPRNATYDEILNNDTTKTYHNWYFNSITQLQSVALMALIYPDNEEYYNNLIKIIWMYLNEYTWAPLGHYSEYYYQRTPKDFDYGLIDIFGASVAFSMAEIKFLFKDRFPKLLVDRMTYEIRRHAIEPYLTRRFFWETHNNNWTAVCTGAIGGVLMYEAPELYYQNQARLHASMECYLASYKDDGMCVEGTAYWGFGFGFFAVFADLERRFTNGEVDWFKNDKIKAISSYVQKMFLQKDIMAMYSDCNIKEGYWIGLAHMLRSIYGDHIEKLPFDRGTIIAYSHFAFSLRTVIFFNPEYISTKLENKVYSAKNSCFFTKRTDNYGFSCKGGNNGESHNHIDVGSFILARNNQQVFYDFGYMGPAPCPGYHDHRRYTYFQPSSFAHNIPYIDGNGESSIATDDVIAFYDESSSSVTMEFGHAYRLDYVKSIKRCFILTDDEIVLNDKYEVTKDCKIVERFVTLIKPKIDGNVITLDDVKLTPTTDCTLELKEQIICDQVQHNGSYDVTCYLIDYVLNENEFNAKIEFTK